MSPASVDQIRIVERLGEISGSRASSAASSETPADAANATAEESRGGWNGGNSISSRSTVQQQVSLGGVGRSASNVLSGSVSGVIGGDLDDTALNELGDNELEGLLEQMWMKVMGQVRLLLLDGVCSGVVNRAVCRLCLRCRRRREYMYFTVLPARSAIVLCSQRYTHSYMIA